MKSPKRTGKTLIELVTVIGLMTSLLAITATTLHRIIRAEVSARHANERLMAVSRSAVAFRGDVHAAREVVVADDGRQLACRLSDGTEVNYTAEPTALLRVTESNKEAYRLHGATVRFGNVDRNGRSVSVMTWQLPTTNIGPALPTDVLTIPVEAVPRLMIAGRDRN